MPLSRTLLEKCLGAAVSGRAVNSLLHRPPTRRLILSYHAVTDRRPQHLQQVCPTRNIKQFREDLFFFGEHFQAMTAADLRELLSGGGPQGKTRFLLTFDDGLRECHTIIRPILKQLGLTALFFISPEFIDNKKMFYRHKASVLVSRIPQWSESTIASVRGFLKIESLLNKNLRQSLMSIPYSAEFALDRIASLAGIDFDDYLRRERPYLTSPEVEELADDGFLLGAHGMDHAGFFELEAKQWLSQVRKSLSRISEVVPEQLSLYSIPFGDAGIPQPYLDAVCSEGNADLSFGNAGWRPDALPRHFQRLPMDRSSDSAAEILGREMHIVRIRSLLGRTYVRR